MSEESKPFVSLVKVPQKILYQKRFPKCFIILLSIIQLIMAGLSITTNVIGLLTRYPQLHFVGVGIWSGVFFGLSGIFGLIASCKPTLGSIVTLMTVSIIATIFSIPLLVISSGGTSETRNCSRRCSDNDLLHAMFAIQIIIGIIQFIASILGSALSCKAICKCFTCCICCRCCRTIDNDEDRIVRYANIESGPIQEARRSVIDTRRSQGRSVTIPVTRARDSVRSVAAIQLRQ